MQKHRSTRQALRAEDTPPELIELLREAYESVLTERIPDDLRQLVERLK
jgi:hypothetical protein